MASTPGQIELRPLAGSVFTEANVSNATSSLSQGVRRSQEAIANASSTQSEDPDFKLPNKRSLLIILVGAAFFQMGFFILVPSSAAYAEHLGGSATFSGLVIGIPVVFGGLSLLPMTRLDNGTYRKPLLLQIGSMIVGSILYAIAYKADFLYLLLIGRVVQGVGFTSFMYSKRYCTDSRFVGVRRRTTLAGWLVVTQGLGLSAGPFIGGVLFKVSGRDNEVWNAFTSVGWVMAGVWSVWWIVAYLFFVDNPPPPPEVEKPPTQPEPVAIPPANQEQQAEPTLTHRVTEQSLTALAQDRVPEEETVTLRTLSTAQWGTIICMCWFAFTCFFILGAFEANIPVFAAQTFNYTPYSSGNFLALGGVVAFPLLFLNVLYARKLQDRIILAVGTTLGFIGIFIFLVQLSVHRSGRVISLAGFFMSWVLVALGFNIASTCTLSLLSKQLPGKWNGNLSMAIQYSNFMGRVTGAVWGGAGLALGMKVFLGIQIMVVAIGASLYTWLWRDLKTKTG